MTDIVGDETLRSLWETMATRWGDHEFLIFENRIGGVFEYTYSQFDEDVNRIANVFLSLGVQKGDHVALHLHSSPEFMMCLFGLAKIGAISVPVNEQYLADEAEYILDNCGAVCAVVEPLYLETYVELVNRGHKFDKGILVARAGVDSPVCDVEFPEMEKRYVSEAHGEQVFYDFWGMRCAQPTTLLEECPLHSDDPAQIIYTSGTTSRPKGVVVTHANMVFSGLYGDWEVSMRGSDRVLSTMPACHSNFQLAALMPVITAGATLIVVEKYSARKFWKQVREYRATVIQLVAMMLRTLMLQPVDPEEKNHFVREALYFITVTDEEKAAFEERFNVRIMNTYGSTESIGWVLTDPPVGKRMWPSVGRAGLGYEVRIANPEDQELPHGEIGEIQVKGVRGRSLMLEYLNNEKATNETFSADGWLKTGDQGYQDDNGWFYFVDRKSNMVKRAGENISTTEIEKILDGHPLIEESAVIGVDDPIRDQALKAFVLPVKGATLTVEEVEEYCKGHMASFKVPSFYEVVTEFPRTCSMKIEKKLLS
ncbi:MAG: crotonobetaine/carnitine-CoA ligase [Coriobacteriia bacterium]|nr:crotonobetaine/carnitine-CoA ligase [Coriobacteriia bacterium]